MFGLYHRLTAKEERELVCQPASPASWLQLPLGWGVKYRSQSSLNPILRLLSLAHLHLHLRRQFLLFRLLIVSLVSEFNTDAEEEDY